MKTTMTAVLALSMMVASAFAAANQDTTKATPGTKSTTSKVKKHKKNVKSTTAVAKPAAAAPGASK
jgi:uncharacterized protein YxeA